MTAPIHRWTVSPLPSDVERSLAKLAELPGAVHVAAMPDCHLAHDVCVGTVLAMCDRIVPAAVGGDIGCGMAALAFDGRVERLRDAHAAARVFTGLERAVPILKHDRREPLPDALADRPLSDPRLLKRAERMGAIQLGTLGRGNHFVELQQDEAGSPWLMVHSGSRGMGQAIRDHHLQRAPDRPGLVLLDAESDAGRAYLQDQEWALAYAEENRRRLVRQVAEVVSDALNWEPVSDSLITCHHNHVRLEEHAVGNSGGEPLWVHRKGAISAADDEPGIVPGSMGTASYHTSGRGHAPALRSSSHGAGRRMSRSEARRRIPRRAFRRTMEGVWYDHRKERRLLDEARDAYRDVDRVLRAQSDLTRVVRRLRPLLSFKGT